MEKVNIMNTLNFKKATSEVIIRPYSKNILYVSAKIGGKTYSTKAAEEIKKFTEEKCEFDEFYYMYITNFTYYTLYKKRSSGEYFILIETYRAFKDVEYQIAPCTEDDYYKIIYSKEVPTEKLW